MEINEDIVDNYIEDRETQEFEEEEQEVYREEVMLALMKLGKHLEEKKEESLAMSNREKWQAKPVTGESAKGKETGKYLHDQEEDLLQNVQSLDISQKEISIQNQQRQKVSYPDDWIDRYVSGQEQPNTSKTERSYQSSVQLECYNGSPMEWFKWIGLYKVKVHESNMRIEEKLARLNQWFPTSSLFRLSRLVSIKLVPIIKSKKDSYFGNV